MNQNRVALVTGVGPGLGASLARRFAREGFAVGLVARHFPFIDDLAREIGNAGGNAIALVADVSRPAEVRSAVERVQSELGTISRFAAQRELVGGRRLARNDPGRFREFVAHRDVRRFRLRTGNGARHDRCGGGHDDLYRRDLQCAWRRLAGL